MAHPTTQHRTTTEAEPEAGGRPVPRIPSRTKGLVSLVAGAAGIVVAVLPSLGIVALLLAAVAIGAGVPAMRRGPRNAGFPLARTGVVLGMIAVLLGFVSLAMQLLG